MNYKYAPGDRVILRSRDEFEERELSKYCASGPDMAGYFGNAFTIKGIYTNRWISFPAYTFEESHDDDYYYSWCESLIAGFEDGFITASFNEDEYNELMSF